ncbi:hypothetical protein KHQ89_02255 [Mycoplasmatota bacterium]|nr:hypothetical protein KHQ89_02255 [Mycoplasmatota bacterium]
MYVAFNFAKVDNSDISSELDSLGAMLSFTMEDMVFTSGYWGGGATSISTGDSAFIKSYAASDPIPRQFLDAGSVIDIADEYKIKLIFLSYSAEDGYKVLYRTGEFTGEVVVTDAMYRDYQYIAFNFSSTTADTDLSDELDILEAQLTISMFDEPLVAHVDEALNFVTGYYEDGKTSITTGDTDFIKGFAASNVLSKASFDGIESITIADGYQLKVIYIGYDHNVYSVMLRTGNMTGSIVLDEAFWGDYEYVAFNFSSVPSSDLSGVLETLPSYVTFVDAVA